MQEQGLPWQHREKAEPKPEGRTPTAEAARVVQGRSLQLSGWKEHARVKGKQAKDDTQKGQAQKMLTSKE